jgi:hypothetical protein
MGGACSTNEIRNAHDILVAKPEGQRPLGRPRDLGVDQRIILEWILGK